MSKPEIKNLPASIQDRLLNQARLSSRPLNELLQYYAIERFLYRLAQSPYTGQFVLKGALLFRVWCLPAFRPTRDIDLL
ncbi:MAG: nucleotidyl transferase AbiEii/AbiGii toxin family protein, partial [Anaerolineales bacterium]